MEYSNNTPICRRNKHLNEFERSKIEVLSSLENLANKNQITILTNRL